MRFILQITLFLEILEIYVADNLIYVCKDAQCNAVFFQQRYRKILKADQKHGS